MFRTETITYMTDDHIRKIAAEVVREELAAQSRPAEATEPEYGWGRLADDLDMTNAYEACVRYMGEGYAADLLRGTCARLMREAGWAAAYVRPDNRRWVLAYARMLPETIQHTAYAPSEPAAYRDMLKHAEVL